MNPNRDRPATLDWLDAMLQPELALSWTLAEWDRVVRLARRMRLLARLAEALQARGLMQSVPQAPRRHLVAMIHVSRWRTSSLHWVATRVAEAIGDGAGPLVLLKGAAYLAEGLPIAPGRLPSDLDILVPRAGLELARQRLGAAGWASAPLSDHDRRYYEEWSHEVPPMNHPIHPVELDLHHNILPPLADSHVAIEPLLARLQSSGWPRWSVLQPEDQVLHSAAHLFLDSEFTDRARDIVDLDGLLRHYGVRAGYLESLLERARQLELTEPLALAVHFAQAWMRTPLPDDWVKQVRSVGPGPARAAWLIPLYRAALTPSEADDPAGIKKRAAATALLIRYHWNRMPLRLLVPHLWHKWRHANDPLTAPEPGA